VLYFIHIYVYMRACIYTRTPHASTHASTHARAHARTHTHTPIV